MNLDSTLLHNVNVFKSSDLNAEKPDSNIAVTSVAAAEWLKSMDSR